VNNGLGTTICYPAANGEVPSIALPLPGNTVIEVISELQITKA
jgi:hypothetical protein